MRRVLKAVVLNVDPGDITTIEDEGSVEEAREAWAALVETRSAEGPGPQAQGPRAGQGKKPQA